MQRSYVPPLAGRSANGSNELGGMTVAVIPAQFVTAPGASELALLLANAATIPASSSSHESSPLLELGLGELFVLELELGEL